LTKASRGCHGICELEAVQVEDVGDGVVKEARVVRDNDWKINISKVIGNGKVYVLEVHVLRLVR
jgi:ribosomal protein L15